MGGSKKFFAFQILLIAIALILASQAQAQNCATENEAVGAATYAVQAAEAQAGDGSNPGVAAYVVNTRNQLELAQANLRACQEHSAQQAPRPTNSGDPNEQLLARCERDANETISQCSTDTSNPLLSQTASANESLTGSMSDANSKNNANNALDTCQKTNNTIGSNREAMNNVKAMCQATYETCQQSCKKANDTLKNIANQALKKRLTQAVSTCSSAQTKLGAIDQNISTIAGAQQRSSNCSNDVTGGQGGEKKDDGKGSDSNANKSDSATQQALNCQLNPNATGCAKMAETCSNGEFAATNATCQCFLYNQCSSKSSASTSADSSSGSSVGSTGSFDSSGGGSSDAGGGGSGKSNNPFSSQWSNPSMAGGGGGGAGGGGNRSGANQADHIGPEESEKTLNTNILNGTRGGGGGGGFAASQIGPRGGSYSPTGNWIPPKMNKNGTVDLNQFRPGMKGRHPASGLQENGLLPASADLFFQVTRRYTIISNTLKP